MSRTPVVITTIFSPTKAISEISKTNPLIIAGDTKTPSSWQHANSEFLSIGRQNELFPSFSKLVATRHYARKNMGYLYAMERFNEIIDTDDDNFPYKGLSGFIKDKVIVSHVSSSNSFFNTYAYFKNTKDILWPRGFPLNLILSGQDIKVRKESGNYAIQQFLIDKDSDFDAVYRLTVNKQVTFKKNTKIALASHTYAPINSQGTYWKKPAFLFLYLPSTVKSRVTDIYRGYIAQRLLWEINANALFMSPLMYQRRNPHNYLNDFKEEIPLYENIREFVEVLEVLKLRGSIQAKMIQVYEALVKKGYFKKEEVEILKAWIKEVDKIL